MTESWKAISGFPDYEVSDLGRVRRTVDRGRGKAGQILKPHNPPGKKYLVVGLVENGKRHPFTVHRLVMDAFVGPLPEGCERSHLDGDPANNALSNLAYESKSENNRRKAEHGTAQRGEKGTLAKLTNGQVLAVRQAAARGRSNRSLARDYRCSKSTIDRIVSRKTWSHLSEPEPVSAPISSCLAERREAGSSTHAPFQQEEF